MSGHWCFVQGFQQVVDIVDRGGRFLPDHFRPFSDGLFFAAFWRCCIFTASNYG